MGGYGRGYGGYGDYGLGYGRGCGYGGYGLGYGRGRFGFGRRFGLGDAEPADVADVADVADLAADVDIKDEVAALDVAGYGLRSVANERDGMTFSGRLSGRTVGLDIWDEKDRRGYNYKAAPTFSTRPMAYNRHRVSYKVDGPTHDIGLTGPKPDLGVAGPKFGYESNGGKLSTSGPMLGNTFKRPSMENIRPTFNFKPVELSFQGGKGITKGPEQHYTGPVIKQKWVAPDVNLDAPGARAELGGPIPDFAVKKAKLGAMVTGPVDDHHHKVEKVFVAPKW